MNYSVLAADPGRKVFRRAYVPSLYRKHVLPAAAQNYYQMNPLNHFTLETHFVHDDNFCEVYTT